MTTRLPLRVEPMPDEWWRSYLLRVAANCGVHPFDLMARVHGIGRARRRHLRWSGIAMTESAATEAGSVVNLKAGEIQAMHLSRYDGSALDFTHLTPEAFDPALTVAADRLPLGGVGPLVKATLDRYCVQCVVEAPGYRAMSWRLQVHLACTRHHLRLASDASNAGDAVSRDVVETQAAVLSRLAPSAENQGFFQHLHAQLVSEIGPWRSSLDRRVQETPEAVLEAFGLAVARVMSPGYPDYQGFAHWPSLSAARHLRPPDSLAYDRSLHVFPHLLPMHHFTHGLADLLHRPQIRQARAMAAVGAAMCATGHPLGVAVRLLPERRRGTTSAMLLNHLVQLEREGRAEQFWRSCAEAATQLIRESVDYRHREKVCGDENAYVIARSAEPSAYPRTIRTWLVDQWACTYTSSNVRPSVRDGSIEYFDRNFGPGMRAALERLLAERAA
ncbi:TniQ family protein [Nostocoides vanveenii]